MDDEARGADQPAAHQWEQPADEGRAAYLRFAVMIATSTVVMYALTYTNLFSIEHAHWSQERAYMAILMGCAMAIVMLGFMWGRMYRDTRLNLIIVAVATAVGGLALLMSQSQAFIGDQLYMKGMIPHHSIAILTSNRADLQDLRVRELAQGIADTQVREIAQMEWLLDDIARNGKATSPAEAQRRSAPQ